jgi:hypothetical protein
MGRKNNYFGGIIGASPLVDATFVAATFDALVIGGGGGGGLNQFTDYRDVGGGGGAEVAALTAQTLANTAYSITIGAGGAKQTAVGSSTPTGTDGGQTTAFGTTAKGGGGGFGHALSSPYVWSAAYSPAVQGGGGSPSSLNNRATSGYTYSGNYHTNGTTARTLPGNHGGGASGAVVNLGAAPTAPGPGVSSTITGSAVEYGIGGYGGWGGYAGGYPDHTDFGCGGRGDGRPSTAGGDGLPGALILRVYGRTKSQAEVEAMITSATNLTVSVAADGADTIVTLSPTTTTTAASFTFTPA